MTPARRIVVSVPTDRLAADLGTLPDGVDLVVWPMDGPAPRDRLDLVVPPYSGMAEVIGRVHDVEVGLVQSQSIGYEGIAELLPAGVAFANAASVHEASTAELAVALVLASQRRIAEFVRAQDAHSWRGRWSQSLADRRVALLGFGGVGTAIASRLAGFEVELTAIARRARVENDVVVRPLTELHAVLAESEIVIASLPGGEATRHVLDAAALAALPDGALVVNVGRGSLIDTDALVAEVRAGRLRAALDVTDPEPLPEEHPLWSLPGALVVPHVGGSSSAMVPRIARLVRRQIDRLVAGESPVNVVIGG